MKIGIGCDHAAFLEKEKLIKYIKNEFNYEVIDFGTKSEDSVDYAEFGHAVGNAIKNDKVNRGIVICGSGIGISIAANKIKGVRAALCTSVEHAEMSRKHNDANILALGARFTSYDEIMRIVQKWFQTDFEGGRHLRRIKKIEKI